MTMTKFSRRQLFCGLATCACAVGWGLRMKTRPGAFRLRPAPGVVYPPTLLRLMARAQFRSAASAAGFIRRRGFPARIDSNAFFGGVEG
jgi:hypothetical protein